ncbi:CDP-glycerol glycerophosphotransferase (TagB/SpsB family) [Leucobacter exalbidus]|uniref:CDP-glycerol glycerophosphotransferase (TagB/SpsB family) n=1 Tax=Leucobacter exalbidus TaxID=662960 RepID=A0A940PV96_9MICO|nr:CDP-glycerol glycerophosphotransferase family protein [Leucobacter exalbidus]MBP1324836.1 CDP-glycerol glycerophosphotransferase (TagB/SpsB family) [Leucobacter exalbidus]
MSSSTRFRFDRGNLDKLLALPKYVLALILSWFVPRVASRWAFGSGAGVGEGALAVAAELLRRDPASRITWLAADQAEAADARAHGFTPVMKQGWDGFWATLRAGQIVVTHGLGDVNRFGVSGGFVTQLWHGAPLKRLHLDSPVTTTVQGPAILRRVLRRMYLRGAAEVDLFVAGSPIAADRLRSAFRVAPGKVRVLGDARDDALAAELHDPAAQAVTRARLLELVPGAASAGRLVMYAPTWRDGDVDPALPSAAERAEIEAALERADAHLIIRSHPLGEGAWVEWTHARVHLLGADLVRDITPLLSAIDWLITDYSSIAIDFALLGRPIMWFAPDLAAYQASRGLYEPLEVTSGGRISHSWQAVGQRLTELTTSTTAQRAAVIETRALAARFHPHAEGGAAGRVLDEIMRLRQPARDLIATPAVFFESFYGRQVSCNPLAIDREIAARAPHVTRYWSVTSETQQVPEGAVALLVGGKDWCAARRYARVLVVNDWLRYGFRRARGQIVLQTWHGTMLKHLALGRPNVGLRTRLAIKRESRRWNLMLSQNPHSTAQFRASYAYRGQVLETGYPRCDRLAQAVIGADRNPVEVGLVRAALGVPAGARVLLYAPTWRDGGVGVVNDLDVHALAHELGDDWVVIARGHTRTHGFGGYAGPGSLGSRNIFDARDSRGLVIDATAHDDINDVLLAADLVVTDYSSIMFDATVARLPLVFFAPDLAAYRDRERGFTFDFEAQAPGPILGTRDEVAEHALALGANGLDAAWVQEYSARYEAWRDTFNPHDDGQAASRVFDELEQRGALAERA